MTNSAETALTIHEENEKDVVITPDLEAKNGETVEATKEEAQDRTDDSTKLERWNQPRANMYRYLTTLLCFINMGMNDAAYGVSRSWSLGRSQANFHRL